MSSRNDNSEIGFGLAMLAAGFILLAVFLFAVAAFVSIALTILSIIAWWKPLRLGSVTITPREAHLFVGGGVVGLLLVPIFIAFWSAIAHYPIPDDWWNYIFLGGYSLGSLGTGFYIAYQEEEEEKRRAARASLALPPQPEASEQAPQPFQFATWDDEENGR